MMWVGWLYWITSVMSIGYLAMSLFKGMSLSERIFSGFVAGCGILPFGLFLLNCIFHVDPLVKHVWPIIVLVALACVMFVRHNMARKNALPKRRTQVHRTPSQVIGVCVILLSIVVFFIGVFQGLRLPLFGWDEYSYWLYATKVITLSHGSATSMATDAYATYPLGFPYLIAWLYNLTHSISIAEAKWVTPIMSLFTLTSMCFVLRRVGLSWLISLCAASLTVWGTQEYYWFNVVAYGEISYVNLYSLAICYGVVWMHSNSTRDLTAFGLFLGLSAFFRVDGSIIAIFTTVLLLLCNYKTALQHKTKMLVVLITTVGIPIVAWSVFKFIYHIHPGWNSRVTFHEISLRLQAPFFNKMVSSFWGTVSDVHLYPISVGIVVILVSLLFIRQKAIVFCLGLAVTQVLYLFAAYLAVFARSEAESAASLSRYLLRIDPILAVALALWLHAWKKNHSVASKKNTA